MGKTKKLPLSMPEPCPICNAKVLMYAVIEWTEGADPGVIQQAEFGCDTEPDIDSEDWPDWHNGHYRMPYVDWMPWEQRAYAWLKKRFRFKFEGAQLSVVTTLKEAGEQR